MADYEHRIVIHDAASKNVKKILNGMEDVVGMTDDLKRRLGLSTKEVDETGRAMNRTKKRTRGLLKEVHSLNRTLRRTTTMFGAAFGISEVARFTNEVINTEQAVANAFGTTGSELKAVTAEVQRISTVFGQDVNESIEATNVLTKQFGLSAQDSLKLIQDALGKGVSKDFLGSIESLAPAFKAAGLSADAALATLVNAERSGAGESLVKAYEEGIKKLQTLDGQGVKDALGAFGIDIKELKANLNSGKMTVGQAMQEVVGRYQEMGSESVEAASALKAIFGDGALEAQGFIAQMGQTNASLSAITDRTTEATKAQRFLFAAWADFKVFIAENVLPVLVNIVEWVKENREALIRWGSWGLKVAAVFGSIWAAAKLLMGLRAMVMTIIGAYKLMTGVLKIAKLAQIAFNIAVSLNPIGIVIAAIAALGVAIYALVRNWDTVKVWLWKMAEQLWKWNPMSWVINFIDKIFPGFKKALWGMSKAIISAFGKAFKWVNNNVIKPMRNAIGGILEWLGIADKKTKDLEQKKDQRTTPKDPKHFTKFFGKMVEPLKEIPKMAKESQVKRPGLLGRMPKIGTSGTKGIGVSAGIAGVQSNSAGAKEVNISIAKLIENQIFKTANLKESKAKIKEEIEKLLLTVVNDANNI